MVLAAVVTILTGVGHIGQEVERHPEWSRPPAVPAEHKLRIDVRQGNERIHIDLVGGESEDYRLLKPVIESLNSGED